MRILTFFLLLLTAPIMAAGTIDSFPEGEKYHQTFLAEARGYLQGEGSVGDSDASLP